MDGVSPDAEQGRLAWRCRRGMKELDLLLGGYLRDRWPTASSSERAAFERILELPDPLLASYLLQREYPSPDLEHVLASLRGQVAGRLPDTTATAAASGPPGA